MPVDTGISSRIDDVQRVIGLFGWEPAGDRKRHTPFDSPVTDVLRWGDNAHCQQFAISSKLHPRHPRHPCLDLGDPEDWRREHMHAIEVAKIPLPDISALHKRHKPGDFLDCYSVPATMAVRDAALIITDFPYWARNLLMIRRIVTAPFGLDNDGPEAADRVGIFPVESETATELIAGFDDKHLDFRVSVLCHDDKISLATWVAPHNVCGRAYLTAIMPFHIAIARNALARVRQASQATHGSRTASF